MTDPADRTNELLRRIRADYAQGQAEVKAALKDLTAETDVTNAHVAALVQHENFTTTKSAGLDDR